MIIIAIFMQISGSALANTNSIKENSNEEINTIKNSIISSENNMQEDNSLIEEQIQDETNVDEDTNKIDKDNSIVTNKDEKNNLVENNTLEDNMEISNDVNTYQAMKINTGRTQEDGIYKINIGKDPNKAIEVGGGSTYNEATIDIWDYGNAQWQKFYFEYENGYYRITAMHTGKSLTVRGNNLVEGAEITQEEYQGLDSQKWVLRDTKINGWVISLQSNPELSISIEGNIANGSKIILSQTEDNDNQMFWLNNITSSEQSHTNGTYRMAVGVDLTKAIGVKGSSKEDNASIEIGKYGNKLTQKFNLEYIDGYYKITSAYSGKSLTVKDNNLTEGAEIVQVDYQGLDSQKWILRDSNKKGWVISLLSNPQLSITIEGSIANGSKMILSKTEDNDNQMYNIEKVSTEQTRQSNGIYRIAVGVDPNKTIEVGGGSTYNDATVDIWDFGNGQQQKFNFEYKEGYYKITARHTGKSLTVKNNNLEEGTPIVQEDYQGLDSQKWILRDTLVNGWIISLQSNPELSITVEGNIANGSKMILSKTEDNNNQMFWLFDITANERTMSDGIYKIEVGANSNKTIEIGGGSTYNNATVDIWDYGNADWQKFDFVYESGYYKITAKHTGKSLTVKNNNLVEGEQIVQSDYQGLDSQKWILRDTLVNGWVISLLSNPELSITIEGNIDNGANLILSKTEDNDNQMFWLPFAQITIVLNPGHGGNSTGCAKGSIVEKNVALTIARKIQANLSKYEDINVILTRNGDYEMDLPSRAMIARNNNADLYVSLHINDEGSHTLTGSQMYVPFYEGSKHYNSNMTRLANLIQDKLSAIGIRKNLPGGTIKRNIDQIPKYQYLMDGQVVQADYYADIRNAMKGDTLDYGPDLNTNTGVPAILVEHCFMNSSDSQFLDSDYDLQRIADADSAAIVEYFGL